MLKKIKSFWDNWKKLGRKFADFQGRLLLTLFYYTLLLPIGLVIKVKKPAPFASSWQTWSLKSNTLEEASNQA